MRYAEGGLDDLIQEKKEEEFVMIEVVQKDIWWTGFGYNTSGVRYTK